MESSWLVLPCFCGKYSPQAPGSPGPPSELGSPEHLKSWGPGPAPELGSTKLALAGAAEGPAPKCVQSGIPW